MAGAAGVKRSGGEQERNLFAPDGILHSGCDTVRIPSIELKKQYCQQVKDVPVIFLFYQIITSVLTMPSMNMKQYHFFVKVHQMIQCCLMSMMLYMKIYAK